MTIDKRAAALFLVSGFVLVAAVFAPAAPLAAGEYAQSERPYWDVGTLNVSLSGACRRGRFNQIKPFRTTIGFQGSKGMGIVGIAKVGYNLYDPTGLAQPGFTYHFFNDGMSNCRVFVAGSRLAR
jgi:hypothetical protein